MLICDKFVHIDHINKKKLEKTHDVCYFIVTIALYYENLSMQYTEIFSVVKIEKSQKKTFAIFLIFAQNIDCGYMLEPPRRGG